MHISANVWAYAHCVSHPDFRSPSLSPGAQSCPLEVLLRQRTAGGSEASAEDASRTAVVGAFFGDWTSEARAIGARGGEDRPLVWHPGRYRTTTVLVEHITGTGGGFL